MFTLTSQYLFPSIKKKIKAATMPSSSSSSTKSTKSTKPECDICGEVCNKSDHKHAQCPSCRTDMCRTCVRKCLLDSVLDPCCPSCKLEWDTEFINNLCGKTWTFQVLRKHRQTVLLDREKAKLPGDADSLALYKQFQVLREQAAKLRKDAEIKKREYEDADAVAQQVTMRSHTLRYGALGKSAKKKSEWEFTHPCSSPSKCPGFLSTVGKCKVCEMWTCLKCFEFKGPSKDSEHECSPDNIASAEFIKKSTKRCPECGVPCTRVSGCTQMWCPQCHTSFSYRTGEVYRQAVHNPERIDWLLNGQAAPTRKRKSQVMVDAAGASASSSSSAPPPCPVQDITYHHLQIMRNMQKTFNIFSHVHYTTNLYNSLRDLSTFAIPTMVARANREDEIRELRILNAMETYMPDDVAKTKLEQIQRRKQMWTQVLHATTLLRDVLTDAVVYLCTHQTQEACAIFKKQYTRITEHTQKRLLDIQKSTKLMTPKLSIHDNSLFQHVYYPS